MPAAKQRTARAVAGLGVLIVIGSIVLSQLRFQGGTISQWNGFCTSGLGQIGQAFSPGGRHDCGLAEFADHAIGWMAAIGIAVTIAAVIVYLTSRAARLRQAHGLVSRRMAGPILPAITRRQDHPARTSSSSM